VHADGLARLVKGRLRDGVVAGEELELHELARLRDDLVGRVGQAAVPGDGDDPGALSWGPVSMPLPPFTSRGLLTGCQARKSGEDECCELHCGRSLWVYW
jgi:hypothetical protein